MENTLIDTIAERPQTTLDITRGVIRLFQNHGLACLAEFKLPNGGRADVAGLDKKGRIVFAEVKSCEADFAVDQKWDGYLEYCDAFYFAVTETFPRDLLPEDEGLIIADGFGGAIVRDAEERALNAARRKALTLKFARQAARQSTSTRL